MAWMRMCLDFRGLGLSGSEGANDEYRGGIEAQPKQTISGTLTAEIKKGI